MITNIFPINIEFEEYDIQRVPYKEDTLKELREKHNITHSFFRDGDFIYISNKDGDENVLLGDIHRCSVLGDEKVTSSLIKHLFFRTFKDRFPQIVPIEFYPFRILSTRETDDLIYTKLPDNLKNIIGFKKQLEIQLRRIENEGVQQFAFVINTERKWIFTKNLKDIVKEGFDITNAEVLFAETLPGLSNVLAPDETFIGIVKTFNSETATVDTNEGVQTYNLSDLLLRKTHSNMINYLNCVIGEESTKAIKAIIDQNKEVIFNAKNIYHEIKAMAKLIAIEVGSTNKVQYLNKEGFVYTIDFSSDIKNKSVTLTPPVFIFDPSGVKTDSSNPDKGLTNHGPYDSSFFDVKSPKILAICAKDNRGNFTKFLKELIEGLPNSKYFTKGLHKKYDLLDIVHDIKEIAKYEYPEYEKIVSALDYKPDLALIEIPDNFKAYRDSENPYYLLKARLMSKEIPVQFITRQKVDRHDEYLLNSITLQMYAKMGGTPWVLPSQRSVDRELIIGIGHSIIRENSYSGADKDRIVGITTFFSSDGQYLLANKAKDVPFDNYFTELLSNIKESIVSLEKIQGWKDGNTIRLIFHIFKPIKNVEFDVISQLVRDFSKYKIQFAFVTISKAHPFLLFDPNQSGIRNSYSNATKGEFIPERGTNIVLNPSSCIVQMIGPRQLKTVKQGVSTPLLVQIKMPTGNFDINNIEDLLFTDIGYIVQQIHFFTYLSWRSFLPGEEPVTMKYSNLISRLLGKLRRVEGWHSDSVNQNLKYKKWFL